MALIRAVPLKSFLETSLSTSGTGTAFNLGAATTGQYVYAAMHLTSASLGTTARMLVMAVQAASSSGFGAATTDFTFALSTDIGSTWPARLSGLSTDQVWWRASWTLSTAASTGGTWKGLVYMGIK